MHRPKVSDKRFERVLDHGRGGDSFDDALSRVLEQLPEPYDEDRIDRNR